VYGPNCPGNFFALLKLVQSAFPLPFAAIKNKRSLIGVDNLVDFLAHCIDKPEAANKTFIISDDADISTPDLIRVLAKAMNRPCLLFPAPYDWLLLLAKAIGRASALEKLCGDLQVDSSFARNTLNWTQPISQGQGLAEVGRWFAST
jgi:nucleoside-diphosphate-sugar epimerase